MMQAVEKLEKQVTKKNNAMAEKNTSHKRKAHQHLHLHPWLNPF